MRTTLLAAVMLLLATIGVSAEVAGNAGQSPTVARVAPHPDPVRELGVDAQPGFHVLWGVEAIAPDDALAVGIGGGNLAVRAKHWNGQRWTPTRPGNGPISEMYDLAGITSTDVWATGNAQHRALANHWDGTAWTQVPTPPPGPGDSEYLKSVDAVSTDDVWAVGYTRLDFGGNDTKPLIEHWDGTSWTRSPYNLPYGNTLGILRGVTVISATDAWAVGITYDERSALLLLHWDGVTWEPVTDINIPTVKDSRVSTLKRSGRSRYRRRVGCRRWPRGAEPAALERPELDTDSVTNAQPGLAGRQLVRRDRSRHRRRVGRRRVRRRLQPRPHPHPALRR